MAKSQSIRTATGWLLRLILAGVFIYAGISKLADLEGFAQVIRGYRILPPVWVSLVAAFLPWLEIFAGGAVLYRRWSQSSAIVLGILLAVFMFALGSAWWRGVNVTCGCFGADQQTGEYVWWMSRDVMLFIMCLAEAVIASSMRRREGLRCATHGSSIGKNVSGAGGR